MDDKRKNPSRYAMTTISEGAHFVGGEMVMGGTADAYGHRKLGGIGAQTGEALKEITGEGIIYQQVGYLMRSGQPDSLDLMVATTTRSWRRICCSRARTGGSSPFGTGST